MEILLVMLVTYNQDESIRQVVCTPGRILDHLRNSHSVTLDDLDVLVLDEVDKLLDMVLIFYLIFIYLYLGLSNLLVWAECIA